MAQLSVRIDFSNGYRMGPGQADLLDAVRDQGSLRKAAGALGMSYPKALKLAEAMNTAFETALLTLHHGGADRGGAALTALGEAVLHHYRAVQKHSADASEADLATLSNRIRAIRRD